MSPLSATIALWPEMPVLPPPDHPFLIRVATSLDRSVARGELRSALRTLLSAWSQIPEDRLPLLETSLGPSWHGELAGHSLGASLAYATAEGWIGLVRGARIGVDAVELEAVADPGAVARHYFSPELHKSIEESSDPAGAFAEAWTGLEARLKCRRCSSAGAPSDRA